ncbi:MAG: CDP-diacylglycerol--glycerol-3-phosphate 3-phosphatidyltransferase [Treponema sp.]|nr:CDP-diacylglycerol--glycerol-3-phosphate 3-phosphatidyltransferase [Treponema sp.]
MSLANFFTLVRLILAPVIFCLLFIPIWTGKFELLSVIITIPLFIFAELTDFLDGFFARRNNEVSDFGKLFDPFADVMLHLTIFVYCLARKLMHPVFFILIFYREFVQMFLRMMAMKKGVSVAARKGGKIKTVLYVIAGGFALIVELLPRCGFEISSIYSNLLYILNLLFIIATMASLLSFVDYAIQFKKIFKKR